MDSKILTLLGIGLLSVAVLVHVICLSMPHYASVNIGETIVSGMAKFGEQKRASFPGKRGWEDVPFDRQSLSVDQPRRGVRDSGQSWAQNVFEKLAKNPSELLKYLHIVGYFGLWKLCAEFDIVQTNLQALICTVFDSDTNFEINLPEIPHVKSVAPGWLKASQAFAIVGLLAMVAGGALAVLSIVKESKGGRLKFLHLFTLGACALGGCAVLLSNIIFASKFWQIWADGNNVPKRMEEMPPVLKDMLNDMFTLDWAFGLDVTAAVLSLVAGVVLFIAGRRMTQKYVEVNLQT
ncbi:uncharacterized protein LOC101848384 [Aplysia californica]|uniref:Uncharacterized protein LOC101848384 n=1 Tax=Aplysia californica TaxID=6500 RepID=A0ABM0K4C8_APLCA|nr:uncharacterized protein LOC101848384 [Aplysia californica]